MIDWSKPVRTKHGKPLAGMVMPARGIGGKRRVALPSLSAYKPHEAATFFLYPEDGVSRCDGAASEYDLENYDPRDGVEVLSLVREALEKRA